MAGENIVGSINELQGGNVVIIRASGEQIVAKPGSAIFEGDTVVTGYGSRAIIRVSNNGNDGVVSVNQSESARFDSVLFDRSANLLVNSSQEEPVDVGERITSEVFRLFNQSLPSSGIKTAAEGSETDRVADNDFFTTRQTVEEIPDAGNPTTFHPPLRERNGERIPGADGATSNTGRPERIPDASTPTDTGSEDNDVEDNEFGSDEADIVVPVDAINDSVTGTEDTPLRISVLGNDIGAADATVSLPSPTSTNGGTITVNSDGTINYVPASNFNGVDTFTYTITSITGQTDTATVTVTVASVDDPVPAAVNDTFTTNEDTPISSNVVGSAGGGLDSNVENGQVIPLNNFITANGGTVTLDTNGNFTYTPLANFNNTDTFTYVVANAEGESSSAVVTINVVGVDDPAPIVTIPDDNGAGVVGDASVVENATLTGGTFTVTASAGLATTGTAFSLTVDGSTTNLTLAQLNALTSGPTPITITAGNDGDLTLTGYNTSTGVVTYSFDPTGTNRDHSGGDTSVLENYTLVAVDSEGDSASDTLDILITDTAPTAVPDSASVTEDGTLNATGNVITNDTVTSLDTVSAVDFGGAQTVGTPFASTYGTLDLNSDGSYSYTLDNTDPEVQGLDAGESLVETFSYTITDTDGDTSSTTLTVTINGTADLPPVVTIPDDNGAGVVGDASVAENATLTAGTFTVTASAGLAATGTAFSLTVDGSTTNLTLAQLTALTAGPTPIAITAGNDGDLTLTGYNASTGVVTYNFDPTGTNRDHSSGDTSVLENYTLVATDNEGDSTSDTLDILITDTAPTATPDTGSVTEDSATTTATGNVITNDTESADTSASVTLLTGGTVGSTLVSEYGTLELSSGGNYTYTIDNTDTAVQALNSGESLTETFTYTIADTDGDTSTSTLTITVNGADEAPSVIIPDDNGVGVVGDVSVAENGAITGGTFTVTSSAGLATTGTALSITVDGSVTNLTLAQLTALTSGPTPITLNAGNDGDLVLTGYNSTTGIVTYNFDPTGSNRDHSGGDTSVLENYTIVATDINSNSNVANTLDVLITDTNPVANDDARSILEGASTISGNVVGIPNSASGDVVDVLVDTNSAPVTDIDFGTTDGTVGTGLAGDYGSLAISSSGVYTYSLDNTNVNVQGLDGTESLVETFTYTITDGDGDTDTANLTVTINGVEDAPPVVTIPDDNGAGVVGDASVSETATLTGGTFTVTADAGLAATGTAFSLTVDGSTTNLTLAQLNALTSGPTPITITSGNDGDLTLTGYNASTGVVTYNFDPTGTSRDHSSGDTSVLENYTLVATDNEGDTTSDTLDILITDTAPTAATDSASVTEETTLSATGNVITNDNATGSDTAFTVSAVDFGGAQTVGTPFASTYGTLDLNEDGSYTYTLDNTDPEVQGLDAGESLVETFSYTITDTDGDTSSTTLAVTINGTADLPPVVTIPDDNGAGVTGDASVAENATLTAGTFTVTASAGLAATGTAFSLTVDGSTTNLTLAQLNALTSGPTPITITAGNDGDLTLTGYNASTGVITYNFDPTGTNRDHSGGEVAENYTLVATDNEGDSTSDTLDILITDTVPTAAADSASVTEETTLSATGNVITNDNATGSDTAFTVSAIDFGGSQTVDMPFTSTYGTLDLNSDGSYTYTLDNTDPEVQGLDAGESLVETFSYTITDTDGDTSSTTLAVTINGTADLPPVVTIPDDNGAGVVGDASVAENATLTAGTFTVTASAGLAATGTAFSLTVDGSTTNLTLAQLTALTTGPTPIAITAGNDGDLTLTGYNASTGVVTYNFDPTGTNRDHTSGDTSVLENYTLVATDNEGDSTSDTLDILITDTAPTAAPDTNSVTEDSATTTATGNVITNDTESADTSASVTLLSGGTVGSTLVSEYGTLELSSGGNYTYTIDNTDTAVQALNSGESLTETFTYTIADTDGDTSTSTLTITVNGTDEAPSVIIPDDNGVGVVGDASVPENGTITGGTFTVTSSAGLATTGTALSVTVDGSVSNLTLAQLNALTSGPTPITINAGNDGDLVLTGYNSTTGVVTYNFDPTGSNRDHSGGDTSVLENYTIVATDINSNSNVANTLDILITDTNPVANDDARSISEGTSAIAGNAVDSGVSGGAGDVTDILIDTSSTPVTDVDFGATDGTVGTGLAGDYGSLQISSSGVYTYTLDNTNVNVQGLDGTESLVETFTYTITDGDGDTDTANLTVTINGVDDAPPVVTIPDSNGAGVTGDESVAENATITGATFTVTATAGLAATGTALSLTVDGDTTNLTLAQLNALTSGPTPITLNAGNDGTLVLTGYNAGTGVITYNFDPTGTNRDHSGGDTSVLENYTIVAIDNEADSTSETLDILITDTQHTAVDDNVGVLTANATISAISSDVDVDNDEILGTGIDLNNDGEADAGTNSGVLGNDTAGADGVISAVSSVNGVSANVGNSVAGTYGNIVINPDGSYTYILDNFDADTNALIQGASATETFAYTIQDGDGDISTANLSITVNGVNDAPLNTVPALVALDSNSTFTFNGANTLIANDVDDNLSTVQLTVSSGTISVGGDIVGGTALTVIGDGTSTITITRGTNNEADLNAILDNLVYSSTGVAAGDVNLTTLSTDALGLTDTDITTIRVVDTATPPTLTNLEGSIPESTGFLRTAYTSQDIRLTGTGVPGSNGSGSSINASEIEGLVETAVGGTVTPESVTRDVGGIGFGIERNTSTFNSSIAGNVTATAENISSENSVLTYTGLIYLESGVEYSFSGYTDDSLHIELGGKTVLSTNTNFTASEFGRLSGIDAGDKTEDTFTPAANGYYSIEIYAGNLDSNGGLLLNLAENREVAGTPGIPKELNGENFNIFAGVDDLIQAGGQISGFVSNTTDTNPDGGYFPVVTGVDIVGVSGQDISLALLPLATEPSDLISNVKITGIPNGDIIKDVNGNTVFTSDGSNTFEFIPVSTLNPTANHLLMPPVLALSGLVISGLEVLTTLTIEATATTLTGTDSALPLTGASFTVGVLPAGYLTDSANSLEADIQSTNDTSIQFGSGVNDSLTATSGGQVLYGAGGNDVLTTSSFAATLLGGLGSDNLQGGERGDRIVGGQGADTLAGGGGTDIFAWASGDETGAPIDTILDFTQGSGGDVLDFSGLLVGENPGNLANFLNLSGTTLTIDVNGTTDGISYDDLTIELTGLTTTTVAQLVADGNIIGGDERVAFLGTSDPDDFNGTSSNEIFFSAGNNSSGDESVRGNGGSDTYAFLSGDPFSSNSLTRLRDFNFQTNAGDEKDIIDLSDILVGATNATVSNYIDINFNSFQGTDVIRVYINGDAPGDGSTNPDIRLEAIGGLANLDDIFSSDADVSVFANNANTYDAAAELAILNSLIANGNLIIE